MERWNEQGNLAEAIISTTQEEPQGNTGTGGVASHQSRTTSELPPIDQASINSAHHDLSYLEGTPSTSPGHPNEPKRYFEGLAENARILGISKTDLLRSEAQSPFNSIVSATSDHSHLPISLQPTVIQHRHAHHPFFDCIPIPAFRDRVILAAATKPPLINRFVICFDMFAGGLNFRGDPSVEQSWIFSDDFREKWGRLLEFDLHELQRRAGSFSA